MRRQIALFLLSFAVTAGCTQLRFFNNAPSTVGVALVGSNACGHGSSGCPVANVKMSVTPSKIGDSFTIQGSATVGEVEIRVRSVTDNGEWRTTSARIATISVSNQIFTYTGTLQSSYQLASSSLKVETGKGYQVLVGSGADFIDGGLFSVQ